MVFNHANQLSQALRALQDTVHDFSRNATERERDFKNRLIEVFGYPYDGDIGPGKTYPSGYDGPDLYHYMYVNTVELNGDTPRSAKHLLLSSPPSWASNTSKPFSYSTFNELKNSFGGGDFYFPDDAPGDPGARLTTNILQITYPYSAADYGFAAPASWGQRRAPGEVQMALSDVVQNEARFKQAQLNYDNLFSENRRLGGSPQAKYDLERDKVVIRNTAKATETGLNITIAAAKTTQRILKDTRELMKDTEENIVEGLPKVVGTASDVFSAVRAGLRWAKTAADHGLVVAEQIAEGVENVADIAKEASKESTALQIEKAGFKLEIQQKLSEIEDLIRQEAGLRVEAFAQREVVEQSLGRLPGRGRQGQTLMDERVAFRKNAAADTQASRYQDMTFRIFRNDAIQKYRAQFDLAAQYVFLAAVAYDFETQLLGGHAGAGRQFLTDIIRQRSLGQVGNGAPISGPSWPRADPRAPVAQL